MQGSNGIGFEGITDKLSLNFSTRSSDTTAPYITSQSPEDNATNVETSDPTIELIFNEEITKGTGNISLFNYSNTFTFCSI